MLKDIGPPPKTGTIAKARKLRRKMSLPEVLLWRVLRKRPGGLKFRRQHAAGPYVLDFYCSDARLAIEVDGLAQTWAFGRSATWRETDGSRSRGLRHCAFPPTAY